MTLSILLQHQGAIEALKQAIPTDGATALRIRKALKQFSSALDDYKKLVEEKLKSIGKTEIKQTDTEWPEIERFLNSALKEELDFTVTAVLSEDDVLSLRVPRRDGTMSGLSVAEIDGAEALGLLNVETGGRL